MLNRCFLLVLLGCLATCTSASADEGIYTGKVISLRPPEPDERKGGVVLYFILDQKPEAKPSRNNLVKVTVLKTTLLKKRAKGKLVPCKLKEITKGCRVWMESSAVAYTLPPKASAFEIIVETGK